MKDFHTMHRLRQNIQRRRPDLNRIKAQEKDQQLTQIIMIEDTLLRKTRQNLNKRNLNFPSENQTNLTTQ